MLTQQKESMRFNYRKEWYNYRGNGFNYNKFDGILRSCIGKHWDKIYSKLIKSFPNKQRYIVDHCVERWVEQNPQFEDGVVYDSRGYQLRYPDYYVENGILKQVKKGPKRKKEYRPAPRVWHTSDPLYKYYRDWDGNYWALKMRAIHSGWNGHDKVLSPDGLINHYGYFLASEHGKQIVEDKLMSFYGSLHYCWLKHRLSPKDAERIFKDVK